MNYLKVDWHQDNPEFPVTMYSELDTERWEVRQVWVYRSGAMEAAGPTIRPGYLSERSTPPIEEIAAQSGLVPQEISQEEFERIWTAAVRAAR